MLLAFRKLRLLILSLQKPCQDRNQESSPSTHFAGKEIERKTIRRLSPGHKAWSMVQQGWWRSPDSAGSLDPQPGSVCPLRADPAPLQTSGTCEDVT